MIKTEEKEMGGLKFTSTQFPCMHSLGLMLRVLNVFGPGIAEDGDGAAMMKGLAQADPAQAQKLIQDLLFQTKVLVPDALGGRYIEFTASPKIDEVFTGKMNLLFEVVGFVMKVNFSNPEAGSAPAAPTAPAAP